MKRQAIAQKITTTRRYLTVQVRFEVGSTVRWVQVRVPWRLLNEQYEDVANYMAMEANEHVKQHVEQLPLPLEKWE